MLYRRRPHGLRLEIGLEAQALMSSSGIDALSIASRRAEEASSESMKRDWSRVAVAIARRTAKHTAPSMAARSFAFA
jgi:hypothetical protein